MNETQPTIVEGEAPVRLVHSVSQPFYRISGKSSLYCHNVLYAPTPKNATFLFVNEDRKESETRDEPLFI